jgi:RNA polymerase sigma-70 factor (ECF subfamily)
MTFEPEAGASEPQPGEPQSELGEAVARLSPGHAEVLMLRFVDGLSLEELARALQIPLGTVKSRLHNALEALRQDERTKKYFLP